MVSPDAIDKGVARVRDGRSRQGAWIEVTAKRFDLARTWADVLAMARAGGDVLLPVAGMFVLLPSLLSTWVLPDRIRPPGQPTAEQLLSVNAAYIIAHWPILLLSALVVAFGSLTLLALLVHGDRPTVGRAMPIALTALPFYILANILQSAAVTVGLLLFVVPGAYLFARFLCVAPVAVAEGRHGPFAIMGRSLRLTRGNGWRILLLLLVILFVAVILSTVLSLIAGIAGALFLPPDIARFLTIFVATAVETAVAVVVTLVSASLYRQATASEVSPFA